MKKFLKWFFIVIIGLAIVLFGLYRYGIYKTKQKSPEETVSYNQGNLHIEVFYNRPSKRDRVIFGELVPYGKTWRTGANEATTFETNQDLLIKNDTLKAGKYSLWTVPGKQEWKVVFNDKMYPWGVSWGAEAAREKAHDALIVTLPREELSKPVEKFTIALDSKAMRLAWDRTQIEVPYRPASR